MTTEYVTVTNGVLEPGAAAWIESQRPGDLPPMQYASVIRLESDIVTVVYGPALPDENGEMELRFQSSNPIWKEPDITKQIYDYLFDDLGAIRTVAYVPEGAEEAIASANDFIDRGYGTYFEGYTEPDAGGIRNLVYVTTKAGYTL